MRRLGMFILLLAVVSACDMLSSVIHDDEVVARVGRERLYLSEARSCVPAFASQEDSAQLVRQYIENWTTSMLFQRMAEDSLSRAELDVDKELEEYRRSLIRYRFEQSYVRSHLDTAVSDAQIEAYYQSHRESYVLERPILKLRFAVIVKESPSREMLKAALSSPDCSAIMQSDSVLRSAALRYADYSQSWNDAAVISREYGLDYLTMLGLKSGDYIIYEPSGLGVQMIGYVADMVRYGIAPVEFCRLRICEAILNTRKRELLSGLEQDLLKEARSNNILEIYQ